MKLERVIIGIMTGTSVDNIDVAAVKFQLNDNNEYTFNLLASNTYSFNNGIDSEIKKAMLNTANTSDISRLNYAISIIFADIIKDFISKNNLNCNIINAVAIHGQTVWHNPSADNCNIASTLQLANGSVLSALLNKTVISDFRAADVALGGQGAPLVPIFDYYFLKSNNNNVIALNIGGMANITYIPQGGGIDNVIAFDTGCGNVLLDEYTRKYYNKPFDKNGEIARTGQINYNLLNELLSLDYFKQSYPKSCGRELFNLSLVENTIYKLKLTNNILYSDVLRTLTELTGITITNSIKICCKSADVIVKGGGIKNHLLMDLIKDKLNRQFNIIDSDNFGISSTYYEAIAFAFLGFLSLESIPGNIPSVTGAKKRVVLGTISRNIS